jgi:hypothetical protein
LVVAFDWAWLTTDCICLTSAVSVSTPLAAAWMVWMPFEMPPSRPDRAAARSVRLEAVKKFTGLSSAVLTFLPVERRFWLVEARAAVSCSESRFWRVAAERVTADGMGEVSR